MKDKVFIVVNTGTPERPEKKYVRRFLSEFLNDYRVIDLPWLLRKILVNLIIIPFRTPKSTALYKKLWSEEGSPLLIHLNNVSSKLSKRLGEDYTVLGAMRYGNPSLEKLLKKVKSGTVKELTVFPLYPHYASSTTGSVNDLIKKNIDILGATPAVKITGQFYSHPAFVEAFVRQVNKYDPHKYDHVLFSYHGLPLRHIQKSHPEVDLTTCNCENELPEHGAFCYKATCYETTRLLSKRLNLAEGSYSVSFQSRLSKNWLTPFTDKRLEELVASGKKRVLIVAPSFVADCLETIVEIGDEYKTLFKQLGGEELTLVESLNDNEDWIEAIVAIAKV
jgi:ferrochelatase